MTVEKGVRGALALGVGEVGVERLPVRPERRGAVREDRAVGARLKARVFQHAGEQGVVVEDRADHQNVRVAVAGLADGLIEPRGELVALLGRADALVVFDVVAEDQVGAALVVAPAAQLLPRADRVDAAAVGEEDRRGLPRFFARLLAEIAQNARIFLQLRLDRIEKADRLCLCVRDKEDVVLVAVERGVERVFEAHDRRFRVAARGGNGGACAGFRQNSTSVAHGVGSVHHARAPEGVQRPVERRRGERKVVREVVFPEVFEVGRRAAVVACVRAEGGERRGAGLFRRLRRLRRGVRAAPACFFYGCAARGGARFVFRHGSPFRERFLRSASENGAHGGVCRPLLCNKGKIF